MKKTTQLTTLASSLLVASHFTWAAGNSITQIELLRSNGDQQVLAITLAKPAALPKSFSLSAPPRIAFDFSDTGSALAQPQVTLPGPLLNNATVVAAGDRSRVVLSLAKASAYQTRVEGNRVLVTLGNVEARPLAASITAPAIERPVVMPVSMASTSSEVSLIDFRRGNDASGRVVIDLPNANSSTDVSRSGKNLIITLGAPLPRRLERRLDVTDFGTPVQNIDANNQGKSSRIVLQNAGEWEFSSYQANKQLVVEVRKISSEQANAALMALGKSVYKGDKLSLNFQNVEVRALLQTLAEFAGFNLVTGDTVTGTMTLRLKDVPWDQALDIVLQQKGLAKRQVGNVIRIAPQADMIALAKQAAEAKEATTLQEPLITEVFQIKYRTVEEVMAAIAGLVDIDSKGKNNAAPANSNNNGMKASAYADPKTNQLIVREKPPVLDEIRAVLAIIDKPSKQVLIEARIVEVNDNFQRDLGVKLGFAKIGGDTSVGSGYGPNGGTPLPGTGNGTQTLPSTPNINLPAGLQGGTLGMIFKGASSIIGLELQAMQTQGIGKIVSSPRVLTADRTKAVIKEGVEIPYQSSSGDQGTTTEFKEANLVLDVTPQITPDNEIILDVQVNKDAANFLKTVNGEPSIDKREVKTQVRIGDGNTVVIGGIYVQNESDTVNKIPLLGDIPVLGHLFRSNSRKNERRELLVFITPRIVESDALIR